MMGPSLRALVFLVTYSRLLLLPSEGFGIVRNQCRVRAKASCIHSQLHFSGSSSGTNGGDDAAYSSNNSTQNDDSSLPMTVNQDSDFSSWMEGLKQWPLIPSSPASKGPDSSTNSGSEPLLSITSSRYRGSNPLVNLVELVDTLDQNKSLSIFSLADQLFRTVMDTAGLFPSPPNANATTVQDLLNQKDWLPIQNSSFLLDPIITSTTNTTYNNNYNNINNNNASAPSLEGMLREATARMESLVQEASLAPSVLPELLERTSQLFSFSSPSGQPSMKVLTVNQSAVESLRDDGRELLQETTNFAANFMAVANTVFTAGYALPAGESSLQYTSTTGTSSDPRPLLSAFESAQCVSIKDDSLAVIQKGAEMGSLAGAIYEDTMSRCHALGHSMVARGTTNDVAWMVTDSYKHSLWTRTITIRGFDASDDTVDRERLLNVICTPKPEILQGVMFHSGLMTTARAIYQSIEKYLDWTAPQQKIVLNGHSIGGSLAVLVLLLLTADRGADFVRDKVVRVYTFGSPPVATVALKRSPSEGQSRYECPVLREFNLPNDIVYGFIQPYDPIVRFMTEYDPLYPLVDDLGRDEKTLYVNGPRRSLRPITRLILSNWEGWPQFRENWKQTNQIHYRSIGMQHLLLPDPQRYLSDRFVSPNVGVPPTDQIVRVSSGELLDALNSAFPLDTFQISLIPQAIRSFLHHFYPAYDSSISNYALRVSKKDVERIGKKTILPEVAVNPKISSSPLSQSRSEFHP